MSSAVTPVGEKKMKCDITRMIDPFYGADPINNILLFRNSDSRNNKNLQKIPNS